MAVKKIIILALLSALLASSLKAQEFETWYELDTSSVTDRVNPERLMSQIAANYLSKYANNYVCEVLQYRTVMMRDTYYELDAYQGIYASLDFNQIYKGELFYNPATKNYLAPLTVMRSYPYGSDGNALKYSAIFGKSERFESSGSYQNNPTNNLLLRKRTLEVASPLNPQLQKLFNYEIEEFFEDDNKEQYVVLIFETKNEVFPAKTPLKGRGRIIYNVLKRAVVSIDIENHIDFYSVRVPAGAVYDASATGHKLEIRYDLIDGKLYTSSITLHAEWIEPQDKTKPAYAFINNSRPDPFENDLKEYERMEFSNFRYINRSENSKVKGLISYIDMNELYMAQFKEDRWKGIEFKEIDMNRLKEDLNRENLTLEQQARRYALSGYQYYWNTLPAREDKPSVEQMKHIKFPLEYFIHARTFIYPQIFGEIY